MRDRGPAVPRRRSILPVGAHSVGDRRLGRPRSGLLRADCGASVTVGLAVAHEMRSSEGDVAASRRGAW